MITTDEKITTTTAAAASTLVLEARITNAVFASGPSYLGLDHAHGSDERKRGRKHRDAHTCTLPGKGRGSGVNGTTVILVNGTMAEVLSVGFPVGVT